MPSIIFSSILIFLTYKQDVNNLSRPCIFQNTIIFQKTAHEHEQTSRPIRSIAESDQIRKNITLTFVPLVPKLQKNLIFNIIFF